ncbi:unnamed protein product [marine sediment metagenome]|uniref:Uncharacterized protein n=1 Tax=marine sediment metagenome TaxID=412755 RepID=X0RFQ5_9ZZZZ
MITVTIAINGQVILARSSVNQKKKKYGKTIYKCDNGSIILHNSDDGAVELAKKMLDTIKEM